MNTIDIINMQKENVNTPLLNLISSDGDPKSVELLIQYGADVNTETTSGKTVLMIASDYAGLRQCYVSIKNQFENVKLLLIHGADINKQDRSGKTALMYACENLNLTIVQLLLDYNADRLLLDNNQKSALYYVTEQFPQNERASKIIKILLNFKL